jgi:dolichol-phosphate mannosyltransferase
MRYAIERRYELLATLDADWSHDPRHLPELVAATGEADVAIGSRYCPGGGVEGWPLHRRVMSQWMNALSRAILGIPVRDMSGAFRAYRVAKLVEIDLAQVRAAGYAFLEEIIWHLHRARAKFVEVPITFRERRAGQSKISVGEATGKLATLVRLAKRNL